MDTTECNMFGRKKFKITLQNQRNIVILSVKLAKLQFHL
jgi:hypothetical protein